MSAVCATILEAILSPKAHIAFSGGPMKAIFCLCKFAEKLYREYKQIKKKNNDFKK